MSDDLLKVSNDMAAAVKIASASIVRVEGRRRRPASGIVWSTGGLILTASHVVRGRGGITIGLPDGSSASAEVAGRDQTTDLALLRVDALNLQPLQQSSDEETAVGQLVLALGRPGHSVQATLGIVSAAAGSWRTRRGGLVDNYLQTDVLMYPGFSGGALINAEAKLLGLNSSALLPGVSMAIPNSSLNRITAALAEHGRMQRGYLGVSTQQVRLPEKLRDSLGQKKGLLIVSVESGSPAETGGLTLGDTIIGIGDSPIRSHDELLARLAADAVDQKVPIKILRGGEVQTQNVKIGERP